MAEQPDVMSRFVTQVQQQFGAAQAVTQAPEAEGPDPWMAEFLARAASLEVGRAAREADEEYQAELRAHLDFLPTPRSRSRVPDEGAA